LPTLPKVDLSVCESIKQLRTYRTLSASQVWCRYCTYKMI